MARLQILALPEGTGDDRPPFVLVVDQTAPQRIALGVDTPWRDYWQDVADKIGARAAIVTPETIDIPANDVPVDENGHPLFLKVHIEGEFEKLREQAEEEIRSVQHRMTASLGRAAITDHERQASLTDALGMDRTRGWDDIRNAAAGIRKERDTQAAAVQRVLGTSHEPLQGDGTETADYLTGYGQGVRAVIAAVYGPVEAHSAPDA